MSVKTITLEEDDLNLLMQCLRHHRTCKIRSSNFDDAKSIEQLAKKIQESSKDLE